MFSCYDGSGQFGSGHGFVHMFRIRLVRVNIGLDTLRLGAQGQQTWPKIVNTATLRHGAWHWWRRWCGSGRVRSNRVNRFDLHPTSAYSDTTKHTTSEKRRWFIVWTLFDISQISKGKKDRETDVYKRNIHSMQRMLKLWNKAMVKVRGARGAQPPCSYLSPPAIVWAPLIESIKCYFLPK